MQLSKRTQENRTEQNRAHGALRVSVEQDHVATLLVRGVSEPTVFRRGRQCTNAVRIARLLAHNAEQLQVTQVNDMQRILCAQYHYLQSTVELSTVLYCTVHSTQLVVVYGNALQFTLVYSMPVLI